MDIETLLRQESPLLLRPTLACVLACAGLTPADRQALWMQRLDFWLRFYEKAGHHRRHKRDGRWWVWNTIDGWQAQFPFWSRSTVKRIIAGSVGAGVTLTGNYNLAGYDRTSWYTIDYERLDDLVRDWQRSQGSLDEEPLQSEPLHGVKLTPCNGSDRDDGSGQSETLERPNVSQPIPEIPIDSAEQERQRVWSRACRELEMQMTRATFAQWVRPLRLATLTGCNGSRQAVLHCSNDYVRDWCQHRLGVRIRDVLAGVLGVPADALEVRYEL